MIVMSESMELYKKKVKENIGILVNQNRLDEAKELLGEYENIIKDDIEVYSIKGVIAMMEGNMDEAERILKEGIYIDDVNYDLNYNLGYLNEIQEKYVEAYKYYKLALEYNDLEMKNELIEKVNNLKKVGQVIEYIEKEKSFPKPPVITIITFVYNTKKYIDECAESVLSQSFREFEWIVLDNGCTDGTSTILKEYADKDSRIKLYKNKENSFLYNKSNNTEFNDYLNNLKSEYVCYLDSDDFLHKDFLKELYLVAKKNNVDIATGGTEMFNDDNPNIRGARCPITFYADDITKVGDVFTKVYCSFRPLWGKLVRRSIYIRTRKFIIENNIKLLNGGDTFMCLIFLKYSKSIVTLNKVLHYYRVRQNSHYNFQVNKKRYLDYLIIYRKSKTLLYKWNKLNNTNLNFITEVLYCSLKQCIDVVVNNLNVPLEDRIQVITNILLDNDVRIILNDRGIYINLVDESMEALNKISDNTKKNYKN